jgi:hypothetical protein
LEIENALPIPFLAFSFLDLLMIAQREAFVKRKRKKMPSFLAH